MTIADLSHIAGRTYPARRRTQNLVGGASPIQAANFAIGYVTLEPDGGQPMAAIRSMAVATRPAATGHGRAIDLTTASGDASAAWRWVDAHGAKYGLRRPMPGYDPAHIQVGQPTINLPHNCARPAFGSPVN